MTSSAGALLALIAWRLVLADAIREMQRFDVDPNSLSNVELLIPLVVSEQGTPSERYDRARPDEDSPFSNIPESAFTLDNDIRVDLGPTPAPAPAHGSRKRELAYRPRSIYLESDESGERPGGVDMWRACERSARARAGLARQLLLLLCAQLLDAPAPTPCACCQQDSNPPWFGPVHGRRDLMPMGENPDIRPPPPLMLQ